MLEVRRVDAGYGRGQVLFDVSLDVNAGEAVALLGRNGAGKTTTLKTIAGLIPAQHGEIRFDGQRTERLPTYRVARLGLGWVPEGRRIFPDLSVAENLEVGRRRSDRRSTSTGGSAPSAASAGAWTRERVFELFPSLADLQHRLGGQISGGEQQMLAIARTLMGNPRVLLLDEAGEGLAPIIVDQLIAALNELKNHGVAMLLAEQSLTLSAAVADRVYIIESGRIKLTRTYTEFDRDQSAREEYLGLD